MAQGNVKLAPIGVGCTYRNYHHLGDFCKYVFGNINNNPEALHFVKEIQKATQATQIRNISKLVYHPLLMNSMERLYFPLSTHMLVQQGVNMGNRNLELQLNRTTKYNWKSQVPNGEFRHQLRRGYDNIITHQIRFHRNMAVHFAESQSEKGITVQSGEEIERQLSQMFPEFLLKVFMRLELEDLNRMVLFTKNL